MKTIGIIGGIGPESTVDYYRSIIARCRERIPDCEYPPILINSVDLRLILQLVSEKRLDELTGYLEKEIEKLARAGADVAIIAANTPHIVFGQLARVAAVPLISIVEATRDAARDAHLRRLALIGTEFTMTGGFYQSVFAESALDLIVPTVEERAVIHQKYMSELVRGTFLPSTRDALLDIFGAMKERDAIDGVILAGTELPLLVRTSTLRGIPILDTTQIHVDAAIAAITK
jgi:aspartate racemase